MRFCPTLLRHRKIILGCALSVFFICRAWNYFNVSASEQKQNCNNSAVNSAKHKRDELVREVAESDKRTWRKTFFTALARVTAAKAGRTRGISREHALKLFYYNNDIFQSGKLSGMKQAKTELALEKPSVMIASHNGLFEHLVEASCKPISPDLVLFNRIFKTGSETTGAIFKFVASMMDYEYTKQTTEDFYDEGKHEPYPMVIEETAKNTQRQIFFSAHFYFRNDLRIQRTHTYVNQIRDPVKRYISHYTYMHSTNRLAWRVEKMIENGEFNETIEQCFEREGQGCKRNVMTRFFCGTEDFCKNGGQKALEKAKANILKYYAVVGLLEHFHLTFQIFQKRFPFFLPVVPRDLDLRINQGIVSNVSIVVSEKMIAAIKQANWADIQLYKFVEQIFWRQAKACGLS